MALRKILFVLVLMLFRVVFDEPYLFYRFHGHFHFLTKKSFQQNLRDCDHFLPVLIVPLSSADIPLARHINNGAPRSESGIVSFLLVCSHEVNPRLAVKSANTKHTQGLSCLFMAAFPTSANASHSSNK